MPRLPAGISRFHREIMPRIAACVRPKRLLRSVRSIVRTDRWNSFDGFHETSQTVAEQYRAAGAQTKIRSIPTGGPLDDGRWRIHEAYDVRSATAKIVSPVRRSLVNYRKNPWCVAQLSGSTPPEGVRGELVVVDNRDHLERLKPGSLRGKVVLTCLDMFHQALHWHESQAAGILCDMPVPDCPDETAWVKLGWGSLPVSQAAAKPVVMALSRNEGRRLRDVLDEQGTVCVEMQVHIERYAGSHDLVSGIVRGRDDPQNEVWAIAHTAEPGAADNASGVAVCLEIARVLEDEIARGTLPRPRRSIRFLNGYECYSFFDELSQSGRFQTPLAGLCVDTVGVAPDLCGGKLNWHSTVPSSADFVNDVGAAMVRAALRGGESGYRFRSRPFVSTEDTLVGDPKYGFPCPWITNHPFRGYHSSADTPAIIHPPGLADCTVATAAYLYYLADADTADVCELAEWVTAKTLRQIRADAARHTDLAQHSRILHAESIQRLKRFLWGGDYDRVTAHFQACEAQVANAGTAPSGYRAKGKRLVPRRTMAILPTTENMLPDLAQQLQDANVPRWTGYWADGVRDTSQIARIVSVEHGRPVSTNQIDKYCEALAEIDYVRIVRSSQSHSRSELVKSLKALGLRSGMNVMVHSSLSAIGHVAGGADDVVEALRKVIGRRGTLLAPSFNHFLAHVFNRLTTPTTNGAIADVFWRHPEAVRSDHPSHAVAAIGPKARAWCADHIENGVWSAESPIGRLIRDEGYILGLGVTNEATTAYHVGETSLDVPCLDAFGSQDQIVMPDGAVRRVQGLAWRDGVCPVSPARLDGALQRGGLLKKGKVGDADSFLVRAKDVWRVRRQHIRKICPTCCVRPQRRVFQCV